MAAGSFAKKPLIAAGSFIAPLAGLVAPTVLPGEASHLQPGKRKHPKEGLRVAAGLGFEPRLTDPLESVSLHPVLFTVVQKTAYLSQISGSRGSRGSPVFTPVTVKPLLKVPGMPRLSLSLSSRQCGSDRRQFLRTEARQSTQHEI